ncbi:MAG: hypothetical protein EOO28_23220 [Comamonadaceae bacterium]|nr:MAG: hypothetical protein EOO28_23220 [Comamonadaceae bacterium]
MFKHLLSATVFCVAATVSLAQAPAEVVRVRGVIQSVDAGSVTVKARSGEVVTLALTDKLVMTEMSPMALEDIKPGSYIGTAAVPMADGTLRSLGVTVFPEAARGNGDGHRPFDLGADSTMTNATVADLMSAPEGRKLKLKYKDGEKTVLVPPGTQVVTFKPGDRSLLVPGATVSLTAQEVAGKPTALRIAAGRNGFAAPY